MLSTPGRIAGFVVLDVWQAAEELGSNANEDNIVSHAVKLNATGAACEGCYKPLPCFLHMIWRVRSTDFQIFFWARDSTSVAEVLTYGIFRLAHASPNGFACE